MSWERANRELIAKLLTELEFEELLAPTDGELVLGELTLPYTSVDRSMHRRVDPSSLRATRGGVEIEVPDADEVIAIGAPILGVDPATTAGLVGEGASTLVSGARQLRDGRAGSGGIVLF